jgi:hypothetical protein
VNVFRIAAVVLFIFAAIGSFSWGVDWTLGTILGLIALGLACLAASSLTSFGEV